MHVNTQSLVEAACPPFLRPYWERIRASPLGSRFATGVFWSLAGAAISRVLMLAATMVVARLLGKTPYGELAMIQSTVGMFGVFAGLGLGLTATKYVAEYRQSDPERAGRILGLSGLVALASGGLMAAGLFVFAPWLAQHTINAPHLAGPLRIGALILFISALNGSQTGALSGFEAFRSIARINLLVGAVSLPILVAGVWLGGLTGAVWALAVNLVFHWLFNHLALRREASLHHVPLTFQGAWTEWSVLWRFSIPAALSGAVVGPANWACAALLVNQPGGYGELGVFNAANQWRTAILFIPSMLAQVVLPVLSNIGGESAGPQYRKVLKLNIMINGGIALVVVLPLLMLAPIVMHAYGAGYESGAAVLRILALSAVLMAINGVVGSAIASRGKMWVGFAFNGLWAAVMLSATALLLSWRRDALGLALASISAYALHTVWQAVYLYRSMGRATSSPAIRQSVGGRGGLAPACEPDTAIEHTETCVDSMATATDATRI